MQYEFIQEQHFTLQQIRECAGKDQLLEAVFSCLPSGKKDSETEKLLLSVPEQASALGAKRILICLQTEPDLQDLKEFLSLCAQFSFFVQIRLSVGTLSGETAEYLFKHSCDVTLAFDPERTPKIMEKMLSAGYASDPEKLSVAFTPRKGNEEEILENASLYSRKKIRVYLDCLTAEGSPVPEDQTPSPEKLERLEKAFSHGRTFCMKHLYSCFIAPDGKVYPCAGMGFPLGDLHEKTLPQILQESKYLELIRQHTLRIKEPCQSCLMITHCCGGCRVRAYKLTGDYLAADPLCRENREKRSQIQTLPIEAEGLLPHEGSMALIDRMIFLSELTSVHEAVIRADNPFLDENGILERSALPEYAAQACAVRDSVEKGGTPSPGLLSEVHHTRFYDIPLKAGDCLHITVQTEFHMDIWYGIRFHIETASHGETVAEGALKICIYDQTPAPY